LENVPRSQDSGPKNASRKVFFNLAISWAGVWFWKSFSGEARLLLAEKPWRVVRSEKFRFSLDFILEGGTRDRRALSHHAGYRVGPAQIEDEIELSRRLAADWKADVGCVAHEVPKIRLTRSVLHLENLRHKLPELQPERCTTYRRHQQRKFHRLDRVVQVLVDFTRPVELHLREFDLRRIFGKDCDRTGPTRRPETPRRAQSKTKFPQGNRYRCETSDVDLIKQAVLNVHAEMAVQAMAEGGANFARPP